MCICFPHMHIALYSMDEFIPEKDVPSLASLVEDHPALDQEQIELEGDVRHNSSSSCATLEICVDSIESAIAAQAGGADRIELCSSLSEGGLTPTPSFLKVVKSLVNIPIFCMVRPRGGPMFFSTAEKEVIIQDTILLKNAGADGIVFGALKPNAEVDEDICRKVLKEACPLPCTFHRAFDLTSNLQKEMQKIIELGFKRILTSGGAKSAIAGNERLRQLVSNAGEDIIIMAGAGINSNNCRQLVIGTRIKEIHASARHPVKKLSQNHTAKMGKVDDIILLVTDAEEVAAIKRICGKKNNLYEMGSSIRD